MIETKKQNLFVLTRDIVEIFEPRDFPCFICPLPKGYKSIIGSIDNLNKKCDEIAKEINRKAENLISPFENILQGYEDRTKTEQKKLLKNFKITQVDIDNRGVSSVQAGNNCNSGDIYLDSNYSSLSLNPKFEKLEKFLEENTAFCCHNMDFYWQALLTREFCIEYFNFLNNQIFKNSKSS